MASVTLSAAAWVSEEWCFLVLRYKAVEQSAVSIVDGWRLVAAATHLENGFVCL